MPLFAVDCIASVELHESLHHLCLSPVQLLFTLERKGKKKKKRKRPTFLSKWELIICCISGTLCKYAVLFVDAVCEYERLGKHFGMNTGRDSNPFFSLTGWNAGLVGLMLLEVVE